MVAGAVSTFSTLIVLVIGSELMISTLVSVPSDGSNWAIACEADQLVGVVAKLAVSVRVAGAWLMRGSMLKRYWPFKSVTVVDTTWALASSNSIGLFAIVVSPGSKMPLWLASL